MIRTSLFLALTALLVLAPVSLIHADVTVLRYYRLRVKPTPSRRMAASPWCRSTA